MSKIHFLNVLEGDCNIIQHDSGRISVIDVSNAYNDYDTAEEIKVRNSEIRKNMYLRTQVPTNKKDYKQKKTPDNPIQYLKKLKINSIFRFIITHPDMDHLDGIKDLFDEFSIQNIWDTCNSKGISDKANSGGYNMDDWKFYKKIRDTEYKEPKRLTYYATNVNDYYNQDYIQILSPTPELIKHCNDKENWNDSSYVLLYTPPKADGGNWKILLAGDSEDKTWEYILNNFEEEVKNIDILFAPHHGRDSGRNYDFLATLNPTITLFGNASSKHLAYNSYPEIRITNNQAGYIILDIQKDKISFYVKNYEFARDFRNNRKWSDPTFDKILDAYHIFDIS
ncbi:hypothetical protein L0669_11760 [Flavobacterium bizetiae]|uniref:ComEC/Rec2 family competence protein n=1 Tax=Flavobacterium bizetiae TaxID=2704140 RepID=UPI0021E93495|nr:hypothetical protein [Flavobacterium bizetiae]UTN06559.1 hypothetical protein L0669_11760 [Flavobacterium bizetiae]